MNVIIIGNGRSVLDTPKQEFIENAEIVIRMNNFRISGFEKYVGSKTSIYSCSQKYLQMLTLTPEQIQEAARERIDKILKNSKGAVNSERERRILEQVQKYGEDAFRKSLWVNSLPPPITSKDVLEVWYLFQKKTDTPLPIKNLVMEDMGCRRLYSTGHRTILYSLIRFPTANIYVTGFDHFLKSGWYWDDAFGMNDNLGRTQNFTDGHPYLIEKKDVRELQKAGKIQII